MRPTHEKAISESPRTKATSFGLLIRYVPGRHSEEHSKERISPHIQPCAKDQNGANQALVRSGRFGIAKTGSARGFNAGATTSRINPTEAGAVTPKTQD